MEEPSAQLAALRIDVPARSEKPKLGTLQPLTLFFETLPEITSLQSFLFSR
jgi:hypothetical protein